MHAHLDSLDWRSEANKVKFNKDKHQDLYLGPQSQLHKSWVHVQNGSRGEGGGGSELAVSSACGMSENREGVVG